MSFESTREFDLNGLSLLVNAFGEGLENTVVASEIVRLGAESVEALNTIKEVLTGIGSPSTEFKANDHAAIITRSDVAFAML